MGCGFCFGVWGLRLCVNGKLGVGVFECLSGCRVKKECGFRGLFGLTRYPHLLVVKFGWAC